MADPLDFGGWINPTQEGGANLPQLPAFIGDIQNTITATLDFLISLLDVALTFLDVVKSFVIGYIDPITALIEAIISEIENLLSDFRNLGIYITGDWNLVQTPFDGLLGGFTGYESRMVSRFIDRTDPTRPDLSPSSALFAAFFYLSADLDALPTLLRFLDLFVKFFNFDISTSKTTLTPADLRVQYGTENTSFYLVKQTADSLLENNQPPNIAQLSWTLSSPVLRTPVFPLPCPSPHGFLIEISTFKDGLSVYYDRPVPNAPTVGDVGSKVQSREGGTVLDPNGNPLIIYGGLDGLKISEDLQYNNTMESSGVVKPGASRVYGIKTPTDKTPIPLDQLVLDDGTYLFQRTIFVPTETIFSADFTNATFLQNARYSFNLNAEDMPYEAEFFDSNGQLAVDLTSLRRPSTFYVRISAVSEAVNSAQDWNLFLDGSVMSVPGNPFKARFGTFTASGGVSGVLSRGDKGDPSTPLEITFPGESSRAFMEAIVASLAVLVLSRSDLEVGSGEAFQIGKAATQTGLEPYSALISEILLASNPDDFFNVVEDDSEIEDVISFRGSLLYRCRAIASRLYKSMGSNPGLEQRILQNPSVQRLLSIDLYALLQERLNTSSATANIERSGRAQLFSSTEGVDYTILDALESAEGRTGIARNPYAASYPLEKGTFRRVAYPEIYVSNRLPGFYEKSEVLGGDYIFIGSCDFSPVLVYDTGIGTIVMEYMRNIFDSDIYSAASLVLGLAASTTLKSPAEGSWINLRLAQLIPPIDGLADTILEWARLLLLGSRATSDIIIEYIEFLEARILELQDLLRRINAITNSIISVKFPAFSSLFLLGQGTDDIVGQFLGSQNKPQDSVNSYGGGVVLVGALPVAGTVLDFLVELFKED